MYIEGKNNWLNHLDAALQKYNNRVHTTTKMTPFEANKKPIDPPTFVNKPKQPHSFAKFQVGDFVRVPDKRKAFIKKVIQQIGIENFLKYTASTKQTQ